MAKTKTKAKTPTAPVYLGPSPNPLDGVDGVAYAECVVDPDGVAHRPKMYGLVIGYRTDYTSYGHGGAVGKPKQLEVTTPAYYAACRTPAPLGTTQPIDRYYSLGYALKNLGHTTCPTCYPEES